MGFRAAQKFSLSDQPADLNFRTRTLARWFRMRYRFGPKWLRCAIKSRAPKRRRPPQRTRDFPRIEALGSLGRTTVGDPAVYGDYAAAGIDVEVPLFTGGLLSARQNEATFKG